MPELNAGPAGPPIRVLVVDDDPLVRRALVRMLAEPEDIVVVGEAADGAEVEDLVARHAPAVVLMDLRMPGVDGITATRRLQQRPDPPAVLVLTTFESDEEITGAVRAGAVGYLVKHTEPERIEAAVRDVAAGVPVTSPSVTRHLMDLAAGPRGAPDRRAMRERLEQLTDQELAVAVEIGKGCSNAGIAERLYLSVSTVKTYASNALAKLELENRTQLALAVRDAGLV